MPEQDSMWLPLTSQLPSAPAQSGCALAWAGLSAHLLTINLSPSAAPLSFHNAPLPVHYISTHQRHVNVTTVCAWYKGPRWLTRNQETSTGIGPARFAGAIAIGLFSHRPRPMAAALCSRTIPVNGVSQTRSEPPRSSKGRLRRERTVEALEPDAPRPAIPSHTGRCFRASLMAS